MPGVGVWAVRWRLVPKTVSGSLRRHAAAVAMAFLRPLLLLWCRSPGCWAAAAGGGARLVAASRRPLWAPTVPASAFPPAGAHCSQCVVACCVCMGPLPHLLLLPAPSSFPFSPTVLSVGLGASLTPAPPSHHGPYQEDEGSGCSHLDCTIAVGFEARVASHHSNASCCQDMSVNLHHSVSLSSFWFFVCRGCCGWWCGVWCVVCAPRRKAAPSWGYGQAVVLPPCCQPWLHWSRSAPLTPYSEGPPSSGSLYRMAVLPG